MMITKEQNITIHLTIEEAKKLNKIIEKVCVNQLSEDVFLFVFDLRKKLKEVVDESV